ncbi:MAG TPA: alpha/beta hydrolase [Phytomonospora sp.]
MTLHPTRAELDLDGRRLSYLDYGGLGQPVLALHGHLHEGSTWEHLAHELAPDWRIFAPDQRGHGDSDRAPDYSRDGYLADAAALLHRLDPGPVVVLGHSLGGLNAFQFAARHPHLVRAMIIEEHGAGTMDGPNPLAFLHGCLYQSNSRAELLEGLGPAGPYFTHALRQLPDGSWRLPFHPDDMITSVEQERGDHWGDWLATDCPALLIRGIRGSIIPAAEAHAMIARRPNTHLIELDTDHMVHTGDPIGYAKAVREFLHSLS